MPEIILGYVYFILFYLLPFFSGGWGIYLEIAALYVRDEV